MTNKHKTAMGQELNAPNTSLIQWLESQLSELITDEQSGLSDLKSFSKNLTSKKNGNVLTEHNIEILKWDLQDWWLIDFEWWTRNDKYFWFEVIGNDIEPTLTPNWDCIIPINFWYDSQRRTKLLVLHIEDQNWNNVYTIPDWANEYNLEISKESRHYYLKQDESWFHMLLK